MSKWSGRQNNGNHPIRTEDRRTNEKNESNIWNLWDNIKHADLRIIGIPEEEEKRGSKIIWRNYGWKLPKPKEGNRYAGTGSTEGPKQDEPKQINTKTYQ